MNNAEGTASAPWTSPGSDVGFQPPQYKLSTLLEQAGNGAIQLPDFQRGYKWDEERIRALLVTMTLGHPLGVVMLLQTSKTINKTPLAAKTNRFVGGASPTIYLPKLEASAGINAQQLDAIVGAHLIDTDALRAADFGRFFLGRRQALLELVEQAMCKRAQRDVDAGELTGGDEAPEAFAEEHDDPQDPDDLLADNGD